MQYEKAEKNYYACTSEAKSAQMHKIIDGYELSEIDKSILHEVANYQMAPDIVAAYLGRIRDLRVELEHAAGQPSLLLEPPNNLVTKLKNMTGFIKESEKKLKEATAFLNNSPPSKANPIEQANHVAVGVGMNMVLEALPLIQNHLEKALHAPPGHGTYKAWYEGKPPPSWVR